MSTSLNRPVLLSPKELRFLVHLIDSKLAEYEARIAAQDASEDELAEILNDKYFLEGLRRALVEAQAASVSKEPE